MKLNRRLPGPGSALGRAQDLVDEAWESATPRAARTLAKKALALSPLCADAYCLLAELATPGSDDELESWRQGVAAGAAAVGEAGFEQDAGEFWLVLETRPYMRARLGLAEALWRRGDRAEAAEHLSEMLRLNPNDNQGVRYILADWLVQLDRSAELAALLAEYPDEDAAAWLWTRALGAFRESGPGPDSRRVLADAMRGNPFVAGYLLDSSLLPEEPPEFYSPGEPDEAVVYVSDLADGWAVTAGALDWLKASVGAAARAATKPRS